jgi:hypothetical protein
MLALRINTHSSADVFYPCASAREHIAINLFFENGGVLSKMLTVLQRW